MEHAETFHDAQGRRIAGILATPDADSHRLVVLCHGFLSTKNSSTNKALTRLLLPNGIATFRFDFFGQGESEGPFEDITVTIAVEQLTTVLRHVREQGYGPLALVGSSFGGLVATLVAAEDRELAALALKCPVADFAEMLRLEFGERGMQHWKHHDEVPDVTGGPRPVRLKYGLYEDALTHDAYKAAASIGAPVLIVQGDCDELVPLHQSRRLIEALRNDKRLDVLPGADHGFTKREDFEAMTTAIATWCTWHLAGGGR